jgi:hypothetical protein
MAAVVVGCFRQNRHDEYVAKIGIMTHRSDDVRAAHLGNGQRDTRQRSVVPHLVETLEAFADHVHLPRVDQFCHHPRNHISPVQPAQTPQRFFVGPPFLAWQEHKHLHCPWPNSKPSPLKVNKTLHVNAAPFCHQVQPPGG